MKQGIRNLPPIETVLDEVEYTKRLVECSKKCSYFAEQFMDLDIFDYNRSFLDCEERFIVLRTGRQCIEKDEFIYLKNGVKKVDDLKNGDEILGGTISNLHKFKDDLIEIRFWNGVRIKVNKDHPFYTKNGWVEASNLTLKDSVMFVNSNTDNNYSIGLKKARLFGYLYSDGYFAEKQSIKFVNNNQDFHNEVRELVKQEFDITSRMTENNTRQLLVGKHGSNQNDLIDYIKRNNLMDDSLSILLELSNNELKEFFNGYFNGDGYLYVGRRKGRKQKKVELGFSVGVSERRAYEIQYLLWKLGIGSVVKKEWMKRSTRPFFRVLITRKDSLEKILSWIDRKKYPKKFGRADKAIQEFNFKRYGNFVEYEENHEWIKIRSIRELNRGTVIGFEVDPTEEIYSYLGMRTHNTGKTRGAAIKAIHFGYFAPLKASNIDEGECNVVVASISKDQAFLIFRKISNFIHKSPTLAKNIIYETKTELRLRWFDGSGSTNFIVRPIGDTGDALRGFTVHFAILDEAAYIPQVVYDAFIPSTVTTKPRILLTSTPKGKAGAFFNACQDTYVIYEKGKSKELHKKDRKHKWVQFHVTTFDNPLAASDPEILDLIKSTTKAAERQELYGEFLDVGDSIIPYNLLQDALVPPDKRPKFEYYELGVDTSGKGQDETVLVTAGVTEQGVMYPVDVYVELTTDQTKLAKKIRELYKTYRYRRIYMDETGIGDTLMDICKDLDPTLPVYGINFKTEKTELYVNLERLFEDPKLINLSLLQDYHRDKMAEQLSYMYWDHGKYKDQQPKARSEHADDYSDGLALVAYGQQKGDFLRELPPEFWNEGYAYSSDEYIGW